MPTPTEQKVTKLHETYCRMTGMEISLNTARKRSWWEWLRWREPEFTAAELRAVMRYLLREIKDLNRRDGALKFSNLIESPDHFEEDLAMAVKAGFLKRETQPPRGQFVKEINKKQDAPTTPPAPQLPPDAFKGLRENLED